jgi:hypothetical protein
VFGGHSRTLARARMARDRRAGAREAVDLCCTQVRGLGRGSAAAPKHCRDHVRAEEREQQHKQGYNDIAVYVLPMVEEVAVDQFVRHDDRDSDRKPDPSVSKKMPPHRDPLVSATSEPTAQYDQLRSRSAHVSFPHAGAPEDLPGGRCF